MARVKTITTDKTAAEIIAEQKEIIATEVAAGHPDIVRARAIAEEMKASGASTMLEGAQPLPKPVLSSDDSFTFVLNDGRKVVMAPPKRLPVQLARIIDGMDRKANIGNVELNARAKMINIMLHVKQVDQTVYSQWIDNWETVETIFDSFGKHWRAIYSIQETLWPEEGEAYWTAIKNDVGVEIS